MGEWFFQEEEEGCGRVHYDFKIFAMVLDSPLNSVKDIVRDLIKSMNSQGVRIPSVMLSAANKAIKTMAWKRAKLDLAKLNPTAAAAAAASAAAASAEGAARPGGALHEPGQRWKRCQHFRNISSPLCAAHRSFNGSVEP